MSTFAARGVRFSYPDDWTLTQQQRDGVFSVHLQSPGTSFWLLTLLPDCPAVEDVLEAAISAYREEYREVDVYRQETPLAGLPTAACTLDFVCLDLVNSAVLKSVALPAFTAFVVFQGEGHEFETLQPQFTALMESLEYTLFDDELAEGVFRDDDGSVPDDAGDDASADDHQSRGDDA
uniref:Uncharacterized protein n=1 Tax=Schlesneria paludicola TaxID=360056 RepID=A0A7C4LMP1_9PLAN